MPFDTPVPNRAKLVQGVHGYAQNSIHAGTTIDFHVSSDVPYTLSVVRLGWSIDDPGRDWPIHRFAESPPAQRTIQPGSYVHVGKRLEGSLAQLTLECWVRPLLIGEHGLITQYAYPAQAGVALLLAPDGRPGCYFGDGGAFRGEWSLWADDPLAIGRWYHLAAVYDAGSVALYRDGLLVARGRGRPRSTVPGPAPLRLGAAGGAEGTSFLLDGDLAMPVIYAHALSETDVRVRALLKPPRVPLDSIGCWPLTEERFRSVADVSGAGRNGTIINRGTWMIGGPGFDATAVPRFEPYDPHRDPRRGHGLRLCSDDWYDCQWPVTQSFTVPSELPPGVYAGRIEHGGSRPYHITFVVKRARDRAPAPLLVLCATATWHAYSLPFGVTPGGLTPYNFYGNHNPFFPDGSEHHDQPAYAIGINMPWPGADPYPAGLVGNYAGLLRCERPLHVWLEQNGYDYDVIGDQDLHEHPEVLRDYAAVLIAGHSEYWSREGYEGVRSYLGAGGKLIVMSGNTMFWRVSYEDGAIECRKYPRSVGGGRGAKVGELWHQQDGKRGGLMREAGLPAWQLIGLECNGYSGQTAPYEVSQPEHAFFRTPEATGARSGMQLGGPEAVKHEWDAQLTAIPGPYTPPAPADYTPRSLAHCTLTTKRLDYRAERAAEAHAVISEIIDWERSGGGRVLAMGSINAPWMLQADPHVAPFLRNALHHMGVVFRLNVLAIGRDGRFKNKWFDGSGWGPSFTDFQDLGTGFGSHAPQGVCWAPGKLGVMAVNAAGDFSYRHWNGAAWGAWENMGSGFVGRPAAVGWGRDRLSLFCRRNDGHVYERSWDGHVWHPWTRMPGLVTSDPSAIGWQGDRLALAARGVHDEIRYRWLERGAWEPNEGWTELDGRFAHAPTLLRWGGNRINLFAVDEAGHLHNRYWNGRSWGPSATGFQDLGGELAGPVVAGCFGPERFTIFGIGRDGALKTKWWSGRAWGPSEHGWEDHGGRFIGTPSVASYRGGHLSVIAVGADHHLWHLHWNGSHWSEWQDMGSDLRESPVVFPWVLARPPAR